MGMKDEREPLKNEGDSPPITRAVHIIGLCVSVWTTTACTPAESPKVATVSLRQGGAPADATVIIDDQPLGAFDFVAAHGVTLPPGLHPVTAPPRGYFAWDRE